MPKHQKQTSKQPSPYELKEYEAQARLPSLWQMWAQEYVYAANRLMQNYCDLRLQWNDSTRIASQIDFEQTGTRPIMLLYGIAIENLIKGIIVAKGQSEVTKDGKFSREIANHRLPNLCTLAGIRIGSADRRLLVRLERAIEIKYPVAKQPQLPDKYSGVWKEVSDYQHILMAFNSLEKKLHKLRPTETAPPLDVTKAGWGPEGCPFARPKKANRRD